MPIQHGVALSTREDGGPGVNYRETASTLWHCMKACQEGVAGGRIGAVVLIYVCTANTG